MQQRGVVEQMLLEQAFERGTQARRCDLGPADTVPGQLVRRDHEHAFRLLRQLGER